MRATILIAFAIIVFSASQSGAQIYVEGDEKCPAGTVKRPWLAESNPPIYECFDDAKDAQCRRTHGKNAWWNLFLKKCSVG